MNAGRDVERLVSGWLVEEAAARSPDRLLDSTRRALVRTNQRRLAAAWREPMYISPLRLAGMAAVLVVGVIGGAVLGRMSVPSGVGGPIGSPTPTPAATVAATDDFATARAAYRAARDAICTRYGAELNPLKDGFALLYDEALTVAERAAIVDDLRTFVERAESMTVELGDLDPPAELVAGHAANVANFENIHRLIREMLVRLAADDLAGAELFDVATNPINEEVLKFEQDVALMNCP
jgi:hypothetical protein